MPPSPLTASALSLGIFRELAWQRAAPRKKLIEVSIPLEAINVASAREKSIRHGHPSTSASVVGAAAVGGVPGRAVRAAGGRSLVVAGAVSDRGGAGGRASAAAPRHRGDGAVGGLEQRGDPERGAVGDRALGRLGPRRGAAGDRATARRSSTICRPRRRRSTIRSPAAARSRWRRSGWACAPTARTSTRWRC